MRRAIPLAYLLCCGSAVAEEGVHWRYSAPPECPNEQEFRAQVRARLLDDEQASVSSLDGSAMSVEVRLEPSLRRASFVLEEAGAPRVERTIEGDSCDELASGLALITALAFGAAEEPAAEPVRYAELPSAPASEPPPVSEAPSATAKRRADIRDAAPVPAASSEGMNLEAGAGGWVNSWLAPDVAFGSDAFVRLAPRARGWSLRLSGLYGFGGTYVDERLAKFTFVGGRIEGCPLSRSLPLSLSGEACLAIELGALHGQGEEGSALREGAAGTVFWAASALLGRLRGRLGERVSLEGQAELGAPWVRHQFVFAEPTERIFRTPALGFAARVGVGIEFL